jgi:DNA-binding NtrC family response regulator
VDVRIIAATNMELLALAQQGKFREDLYHRLDLFRVKLPPLRDRGDDVVTLAEELLARVSKRYGLKPQTIPEEGRARLRKHSWPGNVRELAHEVERAIVFGEDRALSFSHLAPGSAATGGSNENWLRPGFVFPESGFSLEAAIDHLVAMAVNQSGGNVSAAARLLGVSRDVVRYRLKGQKDEPTSGE